MSWTLGATTRRGAGGIRCEGVGGVEDGGCEIEGWCRVEDAEEGRCVTAPPADGHVKPGTQDLSADYFTEVCVT